MGKQFKGMILEVVVFILILKLVSKDLTEESQSGYGFLVRRYR